MVMGFTEREGENSRAYMSKHNSSNNPARFHIFNNSKNLNYILINFLTKLGQSFCFPVIIRYTLLY